MAPVAAIIVAVPTSEHLNDARRGAGAERGDAGIHGVGIAALEGRNDLWTGWR
jgi:hypothetical protein